MIYEFACTDQQRVEISQAVWSDSNAIAEGNFEGYSILNYQADSVVSTASSLYRTGEPAINANLRIKTRKKAAAIFQSVWRENVGVVPDFPLVEIFSFAEGDAVLTAHYLTGGDALKWDVHAIDIAVIREKLRPASIDPPEARTDRA